MIEIQPYIYIVKTQSIFALSRFWHSVSFSLSLLGGPSFGTQSFGTRSIGTQSQHHILISSWVQADQQGLIYHFHFVSGGGNVFKKLTV